MTKTPPPQTEQIEELEAELRYRIGDNFTDRVLPLIKDFLTASNRELLEQLAVKHSVPHRDVKGGWPNGMCVSYKAIEAELKRLGE